MNPTVIIMSYRPLISLGLLGLLAVNQAAASISLSSTRLIFDGKHKEASLTVRNSGEDVLIQSWVDSDNQTAAVPFAVTPPLARISGQEQQLLRVIYEGAGMPNDQESVLWLNVQEIPQASKIKNTLQLAVRQRIKLFFRPAGLTAQAYSAPSELLWQLHNRSGHSLLTVKNPGVYHVSMSDITVVSGTSSELVAESSMIAPGQLKEFPLKQLHSPSLAQLSFASINDYGALDAYSAQLVSTASTTARLNKEPPK